jgi:short-subunit dehydrogenase
MHVLITGASSGIGEAIAREYLARHADITVVARRKDRLVELCAGAQTATHIIAADLAPQSGLRGSTVCADVIAEAQQTLGPIDILINNAGMQVVSSLVDTSLEDGERTIELNLMAPLRMTKAVLPSMIARKRGAIVDIASMAAIMPTVGMAYYSASKGGLGAASEGLRAELKPHGISVLTVYPGPVASDMEAAAREKFSGSSVMRYVPTGTTEELARLVARGVERKQDRIIYPRVYGVSRQFPNISRWLTDRLTPQLK